MPFNNTIFIKVSEINFQILKNLLYSNERAISEGEKNLHYITKMLQGIQKKFSLPIFLDQNCEIPRLFPDLLNIIQNFPDHFP